MSTLFTHTPARDEYNRLAHDLEEQVGEVREREMAYLMTQPKEDVLAAARATFTGETVRASDSKSSLAMGLAQRKANNTDAAKELARLQREMWRESRVTEYIEQARQDVADAAQRLAALATKEPSYSLADDAVRGAIYLRERQTHLRFWDNVVHVAERDGLAPLEAVERTMATALREMLQAVGGGPSLSSSPATNLLTETGRQATAEWYQWAEGLVQYR